VHLLARARARAARRRRPALHTRDDGHRAIVLHDDEPRPRFPRQAFDYRARAARELGYRDRVLGLHLSII
jgi:hypothetical protein